LIKHRLSPHRGLLPQMQPDRWHCAPYKFTYYRPSGLLSTVSAYIHLSFQFTQKSFMP